MNRDMLKCVGWDQALERSCKLLSKRCNIVDYRRAAYFAAKNQRFLPPRHLNIYEIRRHPFSKGCGAL